MSRSLLFVLRFALCLAVLFPTGLLTPAPRAEALPAPQTAPKVAQEDEPTVPEVVTEEAAPAQPPALSVVGHVGGDTYAVEVASNVAYIGEGPQFAILNLSNPQNPSLLGKSPILSTPPVAMKYLANYLYLVNDAFRVFNVSNPLAPAEVASLTVGSNGVGPLVINGNYIYYVQVAGATVAELHVVNISSPAAPSDIAVLTGFMDIRDLVVSGSYLYVADYYNGIQIFDLTNPAAPVQIGEYYRFQTSGFALAGNYGYIAHSQGFDIINVSTPTTPTGISSYNPNTALTKISIRGNYAYATTGIGNALHIVNISNPPSPVVAGIYTSTIPSASRFAAVYVSTGGEYAYLPETYGGLHILDVNPPSAPTEVGLYKILDPWKSSSGGLAVAGNSLYFVGAQASNLRFLQVLSVGNPTQPSRVGQAAIPPNYPVAFLQVEARPPYLYIGQNGDGTRIYNIANPGNIFQEVRLNSEASNGLQIQRNLAYMLGFGSLSTYNVISPNNPILLGTTPFGGGVSMAVRGSYAYVGGSHFTIFKVSNPTISAPTIGIYTFTSGLIYDIAVNGSYAYLAAGSAGLNIININNPVTPTLVGSYTLPGSPTFIQIEVLGNYAYAVEQNTGQLKVIDVTNPASPMEVASFSTGFIKRIAVAGNYVYAITHNHGLYVLNFPNPALPPDTPVRTPIIFIPGAAGSRLYNNLNGQENEIWADPARVSDLNLDPSKNEMRVMGLDSDGESPAVADPAYELHTVDGPRGAVTRIQGIAAFNKPVNSAIYGTLAEHFTATLGYEDNVDFYIFTYDWRKDITPTIPALDALIQHIITTTPGITQVQIVAHSLGGMVTRQYLLDPSRASRVKSAVIIASPLAGTPAGLYGVYNGICMTKVKDFFDWCIPVMEVARAIAPNFTSLYEIAPGPAYFTLKGGTGYVLTATTGDPTNFCPNCLNYNNTYTLAAAVNSQLAEKGKALHTNWGNSPSWNNVPVTLIAGRGANTLAGIIQTKNLWGFGSITELQSRFSPEGDGAVMLMSGRLESYFVNLRGTATACVVTFDSSVTDGHLPITQDPSILAYIDGVLGIGPAIPCPTQGIGAIPPLGPTPTVITSTSHNTQITLMGNDTAELETYNTTGQHTGMYSGTALIEEGIPGSKYSRGESFATVALVSGTYTVAVTSPEVNVVNLVVERSDENGLTQTLFYEGITLTAQSRLELTGDPYLVNNWRLYPTGTGVSQTITPTVSFLPGTQLDTAPPTVTVNITGTAAPQGWYTQPVTVTLTGNDNAGGSGVSYIIYGYTNDRRTRLYTGPFVADPRLVSALMVAVMDKHLNFATTQIRIGPERRYLPFTKK